MTDTLTKYAAWIALVLGVLSVGGSYVQNVGISDGVLGAIGDVPLERYVPAIRYNEGIYTTYPIESEAGFIVDGSLIINAAGYLANSLGINVASSTATVAVQGACTSSSTPASITLGSTSFDNESCIESSMGIGSVTLTFPSPASSQWTAWGLGSPGACRDLVIKNSSTTPDIRLTLAFHANTMRTNTASTSLILHPTTANSTSSALLRVCNVGTSASADDFFVETFITGS